MKKIFVFLFFFPTISFCQQSHTTLYAGFPNISFGEASVFLDSINNPIIISNTSSQQNSINKYDGSSWSGNICPYTTYSSCKDINNNIWMVANGGLVKYDGNQFEFISATISLPANSYAWMTIDNQNEIWILTEDNVGFLNIYSYEIQSSSLSTYSVPSGLSSISYDYGPSRIFFTDSTLYINLSDANIQNCFYKFNPYTSFTDSVLAPFGDWMAWGFIIDNFYFDGQSSFYFIIENTYSGSDNIFLCKMNPSFQSWDTLYSTNDSIGYFNGSGLFKDNDGNIIILNSSKVISYSPINHSGTFYYPRNFIDPLFTNIDLYNYVMDANNNIWGVLDAEDTVNYDPYHMVYKFNKDGIYYFNGTIFQDINSNNSFDSTDFPVSDVLIYSNQNSYSSSNSNGKFQIVFMDTTLTYNVQPIIPNYWQCQNTCSYTVTPSVQLNSNYDFGVTPTGNFDDVNVTVTSITSHPGFGVTQNLLVRNVGTTTNTPVLTYQFDAQENFVNATPTPSTINGNTLTWNLNPLTPFQEQNIQLIFLLPSSVAIGTPLTSVASVQGSGTENTPINNIDSLNQIVTGSFDPNEKTVSPSGNINSGDWLTYTVYFQNTGTDTAFNIDVLDTLNSNLDFSTISIVGFSHPMTWQIKGAGYLKFSFNNILLPDSNTNESLSHGYVSYRIKSKSGTQNGTLIKNTASIYFDFNSSIVTNTTSTIIGSVGMVDVSENNFSLFPNIISSGETIQIISEKIGDELKLIDCTGRILSNEKIMSTSILFQTKNLSAGIYFIQYDNEVKKLIVQ